MRDRPSVPARTLWISVVYRQCSACGFIFTDFFDDFDSDQWAEYIYNDEYVRVDPDYVQARPFRAARQLYATYLSGRSNIVGIDYGGGGGVTAKLLRGVGCAYDTWDPFGVTDMDPARAGTYNLCSSFEVFEHSPAPHRTMREIVDLTTDDRLIVHIETQVHDRQMPRGGRLSWWYAAPRNGHVSLHSRRSLQVLARLHGLEYRAVPHDPGTHLLVRGVSAQESLLLTTRGRIRRKWRDARDAWPRGLRDTSTQ